MSKAQGSALRKSAGTVDKREVIITSALDLFRHYGYRRTSMEDIARAAAVAKGTLYLYFKSKDELFEAICRSLAEQVAEGVTKAEALDLPLEPKLTALMEAKLGFVYRWILSSPHAAELVDSGSRLSEDVFGEVHDQFHNAVRHLVREELAGVLQRVRLDVDDARLQPGDVDGSAQSLDLLLAARGQHDVHGVGVLRARTQHLEIEADLVDGIGDVLIGFGLDLLFHIVAGEHARHFDDLGNHRCTGDGDGRFARARSGTADRARDRLADRLGVGDLLVGDRARRQRFDRVRFHVVARTFA
ncbi:MAG TPA: hypothetical protein DCF73_10285 [Rhodobiaceae bacterium]|nr:hypothetical protein [Rhodobiaceae bacterium]